MSFDEEDATILVFQEGEGKRVVQMDPCIALSDSAKSGRDVIKGEMEREGSWAERGQRGQKLLIRRSGRNTAFARRTFGRRQAILNCRLEA